MLLITCSYAGNGNSAAEIKTARFKIIEVRTVETFYQQAHIQSYRSIVQLRFDGTHRHK